MELNGWTLEYSGKVRDLYSSTQHPDRILMVASDRVSAFDYLLSPAIPGKGAMLTELSLWWFDQLAGMPNHLAPRDDAVEIPDDVADRAMLVEKLEMFPVECVVRGYLSGSGWLEYQSTQSVCGLPLPAGLTDGDRLPEPIFTPAFKAQFGEHDENISFEHTAELVGLDNATALRDLSLNIFARASAIAEARGVILADTKFEFGTAGDGTITLGDEVLTSDSSRYWDAETYATGDRTASFDKQIVRNWLRANWDQQGEPPRLPDEIVAQTAARYRELVGSVHRVIIRAVEWDDPAGITLREAQRHEVAERYGRPDSEPGPAPSESDITVFLVAFEGAEAVACGGLRQIDESHGEIKRMFVSPDHRGSGVATALLRALEDQARGRAWDRLVLETGDRLLTAIRFYEREGYTRIPNFGHYANSALSLCYGRSLESR